MAKEPDERYATCGELAQDAQAALGISGQLTAPSTTPPRSRRLLVFAALALAAIATVVAVVLVLTRSDGGTPVTRAPDTKPTLAITADSIQHIDPATNTLAGTTRIGGEISQVAVGEGAIWATDAANNLLFRVSPRSGVGHRARCNRGSPDGRCRGLRCCLGRNPRLAQLDRPDRCDKHCRSEGTWGERVRLHAGRHDVLGPVVISEHNFWVDSTDPRGWLWWMFHPMTDFRGNVNAPPPTGIPFASAGGGVLWIASYLVDGTGKIGGQLERVDESSHRYLGSTRLEFVPGGLAAGDGAVWISDAKASQVVRIDAATGTRREADPGRPRPERSGSRNWRRLGRPTTTTAPSRASIRRRTQSWPPSTSALTPTTSPPT